MAYTLTPRDRADMKRMGRTHRGWFKNHSGIPFHQDFMSEEKLTSFCKAVREAGGTVVATAEREV